jgi:hypothetical protein
VTEGDTVEWIAADSLGLPQGINHERIQKQVAKILSDNDMSEEEFLLPGKTLRIYWENEEYRLPGDGTGNMDGKLPECPSVS